MKAKKNTIEIAKWYVEVLNMDGQPVVKLEDFQTVTKHLSWLHEDDGIYIDNLEGEKDELKDEVKQLKNMINVTIGLAYSKDENEAIDYLINEKEQSLLFPEDQSWKRQNKK